MSARRNHRDLTTGRCGGEDKEASHHATTRRTPTARSGRTDPSHPPTQTTAESSNLYQLTGRSSSAPTEARGAGQARRGPRRGSRLRPTWPGRRDALQPELAVGARPRRGTHNLPATAYRGKQIRAQESPTNSKASVTTSSQSLNWQQKAGYARGSVDDISVRTHSPMGTYLTLLPISGLAS